MQRIFAGGIVFLTLIIVADNPSTATIAVAFAYLILLSAAMTVGPVAFARISSLVGATAPPHTSAFDLAHHTTP
jgi:hypothetical protein